MCHSSSGAVLALCLSGSLFAQSPLYDHFGDSTQNQLGTWVEPLGDIDGDGLADYVSGAPFTITTRYARLWSGRDGTVIRDTVQPGTISWYGYRVCGGGDVNADGVPDYGVSTWNGNGQIWIHSGKDGKLLYTKSGGAGDSLGYSVQIVSDLNGDKHADFLACAYYNGKNGAGYVSVWSGKDGSLLRTHDGPAGFGGYGRALSAGGDIDKDGVADYAIASPGYQNVGLVDLFSGKTGALIRSLKGTTTGEWFGIGLDIRGDVNRDGYADVAVGSLRGGANGGGYVTVYSGSDGKSFRTVDGAKSNDGHGESVAWVGDVNGDGFPELLVGAAGADVNGSSSGSAHLYDGRWIFLGIGTAQVAVYSGDSAGDSLGRSVAGLGDVNGDKVPDFAVGAIGDDQNGTNSGLVRVFSGADLSLRSSAHLHSLAQGGKVRLDLDAGSANASGLYLVLGSISGVNPGLLFGSVHVPINFDAYSNLLLLGPNSLIQRSVGTLDAQGRATAEFALPTNFAPGLAGLRLDHAFVVFNSAFSGLSFASNSLPLTLQK